MKPALALAFAFAVGLTSTVRGSLLEEARALAAEGKFEAVVSRLETEVQRPAAELALIKEYALALYFTRQWDKVLPWMERGLSMDRKHAVSWRTLKAKVLSYLGRYRESAADYAEAERVLAAKGEGLTGFSSEPDRLMWEHLMVAMADESMVEKYLVLGALAAVTRDNKVPEEARVRVQKNLELYENIAAKGPEKSKALAIIVIDGWAKEDQTKGRPPKQDGKASSP